MVERYRATASYQASTSGEMQLVENDIVTVIEKNQTGLLTALKTAASATFGRSLISTNEPIT